VAQEMFRHVRDAVSLGILKDKSRIAPYSTSKTSKEKKEIETLTRCHWDGTHLVL
jgi:hypothetical protein